MESFFFFIVVGFQGFTKIYWVCEVWDNSFSVLFEMIWNDGNACLPASKGTKNEKSWKKKVEKKKKIKLKMKTYPMYV